MPNTTPEVVQKVGAIHSQVWQTVGLTVSEAAGFEVNFSDPLTVSIPSSDVYAEATSPQLVIQFAFASLPENAMMLMISADTFGAMAASMKGETVAHVDEALVTDVRPVLEAIIQGICLGVGNARNEPMVASGLSIRYQIPNFSPNLQRPGELIRTGIAVTCEDFSGTLVWVMDIETAHLVAGIDYHEENSSVFANFAGAGGSGLSADSSSIGENGLDIIMDIPLEVSVELGRVKLQVREVVELGAGSIVEIDKAAGEPVDVLVNGRLVARGEVVVIDDNFGVRITEILSVQERLQKLNEAA